MSHNEVEKEKRTLAEHLRKVELSKKKEELGEAYLKLDKIKEEYRNIKERYYTYFL